ncbi:TPA: hypothetical protein QCX97_003481 [Bacillus wiedmannii]|uniref:hypothetical protein n=1 Tax=Bacillus wiedmannii TaxID=1890302 RepID=UPI00027AB88D|nr:hypothetical protein [Bacillus wiedmannii]EJS62982.1 hypothetical protein ICW_05645 [Bacillus wiedmannii]MDR4942978.1 hypothetical protein [Bacillus wiedmannii]OFC98620.1 hypothetical protein BTGOE6_52650 [Bacillus wiedmannii]HDR7669594.1 hypothetical protein [Bacillus wiedmannii]
MKELDVFFKALTEELNGEQMEVGDEFVYTCNNAVVIFKMDYNEKQEKTLDIRIIGGKAVHIDTELPIFE